VAQFRETGGSKSGQYAADLDCRNQVDFVAREQERRIAAETQFVNDHRVALEALRDAAEQRRLNLWEH